MYGGVGKDSSPDPCESANIRGKKNKINAVQASHLDRIARERDANRFHRVKRRIVNSEDRAPERAHILLVHPAGNPSANTRFADIGLRRLCKRRRQSSFLGKDSLRRPQRPSFLEQRRSAFLKTLPVGSPSRTTGHRQLCNSREQAQCISRLHWEHCARIRNQSQPKIDAGLCRNCGGRDFLVEREGKSGENSWPIIQRSKNDGTRATVQTCRRVDALFSTLYARGVPARDRKECCCR